MKISEAKIFASLLAIFEKQKGKLKRDILEEIEIPEAISIKGERGEKGEPGRDGIDGNTGDSGEKGDRGLPGSDGKDGNPGKDGARGKDGIPGPPGRDGRHGTDGKDGSPGKDGETGKPGPRGVKGKPGEDGLNGKDGTDGLQGERGLRGVKGPKGDKGDKGPAGIDGTKGDKGDKGPTGPKGKDGKDGVDGKDGTGFDPKELQKLKREFNHHRDISNRQLASLGGGGSSRILDMDDVVFNYPSQLANNDILTFDASQEKFTALNIVTIINNIKTQLDLEMQYDRLIEEVIVGANTFTYIGQADPGSVKTDTVWRIKRIAEYANGTIEDAWANDSDAFSRVWTDRLTYNYNI